MANTLSFHLCFFVVFILSCQSLIEASNNAAGFSVQLLRHNSRFHKSGEVYNSFYQVPQKSSSSQNGNGATTGVTSNNGDCLMKLTLGTPPVDIYGLVDTGSDLVWTQCKPCSGCYEQNNPMFDPLKSKTYRNIQCNSEQCNSLPGISCSSHNLCAYTYGYGDDSVTKGLLAREKVTFISSSNGEAVVVGDIIFGCGHNNRGTFNENDMGIIGMGGGPLSLVSQLGTHYGSRRFSQCLVPFHTDPDISGTISFGAESEVSGEGVVTTPLVSGEGQTYYLVTLNGISVGNKFVPFDSSQEVSTGNIMIDSGTPATYIPQELYDGLVEELKAQVKHTRTPIEDDPSLGTQLCYRSDENLEGPILTAHFEGADVELKPAQTFIPPKDGVFCFAMAGATDGQYIFGNFAQSNILIGFDLDTKTVSFKPTDCTKQ
ncbi:Xylanase inhibitor, C-terminal [Sesbania bispinosa]|nr:Xylanase inhibitor, C-terminal [Sesbania bispinosa]